MKQQIHGAAEDEPPKRGYAGAPPSSSFRAMEAAERPAAASRGFGATTAASGRDPLMALSVNLVSLDGAMPRPLNNSVSENVSGGGLRLNA